MSTFICASIATPFSKAPHNGWVVASRCESLACCIGSAKAFVHAKINGDGRRASLVVRNHNAHRSAVATRRSISGLELAELKELLRQSQLPVSGNKPELVRRLVEHANEA